MVCSSHSNYSNYITFTFTLVLISAGGIHRHFSHVCMLFRAVFTKYCISIVLFKYPNIQALVPTTIIHYKEQTIITFFVCTYDTT